MNSCPTWNAPSGSPTRTTFTGECTGQGIHIRRLRVQAEHDAWRRSSATGPYRAHGRDERGEEADVALAQERATYPAAAAQGACQYSSSRPLPTAKGLESKR